ncbi:MAG TPA: NUDIX hydrolase [Candidatus Limnocylindrales bacterium]|nr:NUDIX hydrolase [Candidatus Limnocylindrales bacterium]
MNTEPEKPFQTLSSRVAYQNPWITVREDTILRPSGEEGLYGVIEVKDSSVIVAVDAKERICLVREYRYAAQKWCWELPMGGIGSDTPLVAAKRELEEEAGLQASSWHELGSSRMHTGLFTERQYVYVATDLTKGAAKDAD